MKTAIVVCSTDGKCLPVFLESLKQYVPKEIPLVLSCHKYPDELLTSARYFRIHHNSGGSYGAAYNAAVGYAFKNPDMDSVVVCNDDIVLLPDSWEKLMRDVATARLMLREGENLGWVAARSDFVAGQQNIRFPGLNSAGLVWLRWPCEYSVERAEAARPTLAWCSREAWVDYPETNWFSDDIQNYDMRKAGFQHFIGTSYVHHVGSASIGTDADKHVREAEAWVKENRPDVYHEFFGG